MNKKVKIRAIERDERSIQLPLRLPLGKALAGLKATILEAIQAENYELIDAFCRTKLLPLLEAQSELAYLKGGRRAELSAEKVVRESAQEFAPVKFSLGDDGDAQARGTIEYLRRISGIDPSKASSKFKRHIAGAIGGLSKEITSEVRKAVEDLVKQGIHLRGGKARIQEILAQHNVQVANTPALAETLFRTQSQQAYAAGRWNTVNDGDYGGCIWGFEYVTAGDNRVREGHRVLEGVRLPKEDPFWKKYFPPNGWNCRCTALEIWKDEETAKIDFGITGRDPRKRTPSGMNVPEEFRGNVGIFAAATLKTLKTPKTPKKEKAPAFVFPPTPDNLSVVDANIGGSTGAKKVSDEHGRLFIMKTGGGNAKVSAEHLKSECSADAFYRAMGVSVPDFRQYERNGQVVKLSQFMENVKPFASWWNSASSQEKDQMRSRLLDGFHTDVLLGNWDVLGMGGDNILVDRNGNPQRIDNGGSLGFRAQGTPKTPAQWKDGWPDDVWTMRGLNPDRTDFAYANHWTKEVFSEFKTLDILTGIAKKDWSKALDVLSAEDRAVVEKRLAEIRRLAERAEPYHTEGYVEEGVETIISHSYRLSKEGFREAAPKQISQGNFGFCRSQRQSRFQPQTSNAAALDLKVQNAVEKALKTVNFHLEDKNYNQTALQAAYDLKPELQQILETGSETEKAGAKHYLDAIEKIQKKVKSKAKKPQKLPFIDCSVSVSAPIPTAPQPEAPAQKYRSLTDWIHSSMTPEEVKYIVEWQSVQSSDSYYPKACSYKIAKLFSQGIKTIQDAQKAGYYVGIENNTGTPGRHWKSILKQMYEISRDTKELNVLMNAYWKYQSAIELLLENTDFEGKDSATRTVILARTENEGIFGARPDVGLLKFSTGVNESHSIFNVTQVYGDVLTMVRVPYHRITGAYFLERSSGFEKTCFANDKENEFNADTHGLDIYCVKKGAAVKGENLAPYRQVFLQLEKRNKK